MSKLDFPLFHGTCTLFLERIAQHGLGGWDPVKEWRALECLREMVPLVEANQHRSEVLQTHLSTTLIMAAQSAEGQNFQHGQVYLSPTEQTAVRYACSKRKGSELISRVVLLAEELERLKVAEVEHDFAPRYPELFALRDIDAAPVLVRIDGVTERMLLSEKGGSPDKFLGLIRERLQADPAGYQLSTQQFNFRLTRAIPVEAIKVNLIAVRKWTAWKVDYGLLPVNLADHRAQR